MSRPKNSKPDQSAKIPKTIGDYTVLPLVLPIQPNFPPSIPQPILHYCYIKADAPREPTIDTPRSLYISNVPIDSTEVAFRKLFKSLHSSALVERADFENDTDAQAPLRVLKDLGLKVGSEVSIRGTTMVSEGYNNNTKDGVLERQDEQVDQDITSTAAAAASASKKRKRELAEDTELLSVAQEMVMPRLWNRPLRKSGSSAIIIFVDRSSMLLALRAIEKHVQKSTTTPLPWIPDPSSSFVGSNRYKSHNTLIHPSPTLLLTKITTYLNAFTALETQRSRLLKTQSAIPDPDGFITVSRGAGNRSAPAARIEDAMAAQEKLREREAKKLKKGGADFYRFQSREERKRRERELREGFEGDRRRVMEMRERRGRLRPE